MVEKVSDTSARKSLEESAREGKIHLEQGMLRGTARWGYIDRQGKVVIPMKYDRVEKFQSGLATVLEGGSLSYIDPKGNVIFQMHFPE